MKTTTDTIKLQRILTSLQRRAGLECVEQATAGDNDVRAFTVSNREGYRSHSVFMYFTPGQRSGRLSFWLYNHRTHKSSRLTRSAAYSWFATLDR